MTIDQIKSAIQSSNSSLSARGIAVYYGMDCTSELLNEIRHDCSELAEIGELVCFTIEDGTQFFGMA
jgi:hypothetical protein